MKAEAVMMKKTRAQEREGKGRWMKRRKRGNRTWKTEGDRCEQQDVCQANPHMVQGGDVVSTRRDSMTGSLRSGKNPHAYSVPGEQEGKLLYGDHTVRALDGHTGQPGKVLDGITTTSPGLLNSRYNELSVFMKLIGARDLKAL